jgi:hypothetical protein
VGTGFGVDPDKVVEHATDLRNMVFSRIEGAANVAKEVGIGGEEYGLILQHVIPPAIELFTEDAGECLDKIVEFGDAIEGALTGVSMDYYAADQEAAKDLQKMAEAMGA